MGLREKLVPCMMAIVSMACVFSAAAQELRTPHVGVQAGLLGLGLVAGYDFHEAVAVRAQLHRFSYDYDDTEAGNHYTGELALSSLAALLDWHLGGAFRLSAGAVSNGNELAVDARSTALDIGSDGYDGNLSVQMTFERLVPYAGIGWSTGRGKRGIGVVIDVGVVFQGVPVVTVEGIAYSSEGEACSFRVAGDSSTSLTGAACVALDDLQQDASHEHEELMDALADFEIYPVASAGLVYRF